MVGIVDTVVKLPFEVAAIHSTGVGSNDFGNLGCGIWNAYVHIVCGVEVGIFPCAVNANNGFGDDFVALGHRICVELGGMLILSDEFRSDLSKNIIESLGHAAWLAGECALQCVCAFGFIIFISALT